MITTYPDLLPPNAYAFERALSGPTGRITAIPTPLRDLWRWDTCPLELLPWLAWAMSVDIWSDTWPEERKRAIIRESFELHRRKGTLYAIERYLSYADAPLKRAIVPPDKAFAGMAMTPAERDAWLGRFPQIRVFRFRNRGVATKGAFTTSGSRLSKLFLSDSSGAGAFFPFQTSAPERIGRRAYLWDKGTHFLASQQETALRWLERTRVDVQETVYDHEQVLIPGSKVQALFPGQVAGNFDKKSGRLFPIASTARTRIVTLSIGRSQSTAADVLAQKTVAPSLAPIKAFPDVVAERGMSYRGMQMFCGHRGRFLDPQTKQRNVVKGFVGGFLPETSSADRLYERLHLHDPARQPEGRPRAIYAGHFRLGMPKFHAELSVSIIGRRSSYAFGRFVFGHLSKADPGPLNLARMAVERSKAKRDKVLLRTALHHTISTRDRITSNSGFRSGGLISQLH